MVEVVFDFLQFRPNMLDPQDIRHIDYPLSNYGSRYTFLPDMHSVDRWVMTSLQGSKSLRYIVLWVE